MELTPEEKKLAKLEQIFKLADQDYVTSEELVALLDALTQLIGKNNENLVREMEGMSQHLSSLESNTEMGMEEKAQEMSAMKKEMASMCAEVMKECEKKMAEMEKKIPEETDLTGLEKKIEEIEGKIPEVPKIEDIENDLPKLGEKIRDGLELITDEEEKLSIQAIGHLAEILEKIQKELKTKSSGGGGGFNYGSMNIHIVDDEVPTNTGDDLNFTINHAPSPVSSLKVYRGGARLRINEDYTFSQVTITLINALQTGEILLVDYRI